MHVALNLSLAGLHTSSCSVATRCAHFTFESSKISLGRYYKVPMCLRTTSLASLNVRNVISLVLFSLSRNLIRVCPRREGLGKIKLFVMSAVHLHCDKLSEGDSERNQLRSLLPSPPPEYRIRKVINKKPVWQSRRNKEKEKGVLKYS